MKLAEEYGCISGNFTEYIGLDKDFDEENWFMNNPSKTYEEYKICYKFMKKLDRLARYKKNFY